VRAVNWQGRIFEQTFDAESTSCEWSQSCISCSIQVHNFVTHHAQILESICVGELGAIKVKLWRSRLSRVALSHATEGLNSTLCSLANPVLRHMSARVLQQASVLLL